MLYPLKFEPILKDKIWGGTKLKIFSINLPHPTNLEKAGNYQDTKMTNRWSAMVFWLATTLLN